MKRTVLAAAIGCTVACQQRATPPPSFFSPRSGSSPVALFSNGGFENGTLGSWTLESFINNGVTYPTMNGTTVPPQTLSDLGLAAGGVANTTAVGPNAALTQIPNGLSGTTTLRWPIYGSYAGVVNGQHAVSQLNGTYPYGANQNVNSIKQDMVVATTDVDPIDGLVHVRFLVAPVLQNPNHTTTQQPYYYLHVKNVTTGQELFNRFNYVSQPGVPWQTDAGATIDYLAWEAIDVAAPGVISVGDDVQAQVIAAGCSLGGHWGEAYVDQFGAFLGGLSVVARQPQFANEGTNVTAAYTVNNDSSSAMTNVVITIPTPNNATFGSFTPPSSMTCTGIPAAGATGTITCTIASMSPLSAIAFSVVWKANSGLTLPQDLGNGAYGVKSDQQAFLLGMPATTYLTNPASMQYADYSVSIDDGVTAISAGQLLTYTIVVKNNGPATPLSGAAVASTPVVETNSTGGLNTITWTCTAAGTSGGKSSSCGAASGTGLINSSVRLVAGGTATYVVKAVAAAPASGNYVNNTIAVTTSGLPAGYGDPEATNNVNGDSDQFGVALINVTVNKDAGGAGTGLVSSAPAGINCGSACTTQTAQFASGVQVTLTAVPDSGMTFASWTAGPCSGSVAQQCTFSPTLATTVTAMFLPPSYAITASSGGNGTIVCSTPVFQAQSSTCTISPATGYALASLTDNGANVLASVTGGNSYVISNVQAAHTVVAGFLKTLGTLCGGAVECGSGSCVDGVCCNTSCNGQCQACNVNAGGVTPGTCTIVTGAPVGARPACSTDGSSCGGSCDGTSATVCAYPGASTNCRAASCAAGTQTSAAACNGTGSCPASGTQACNAYVCGANACKTTCATSSDCIAGDYCNASSQCVPKVADGGSCSASAQCTNGNCVDGICCNSACGGQCQACDVPGKVGVCSAVTGAPHGARTACATDGSSCGGSCDGVGIAACAYPTTSCRGASCTAGTQTAAASCSGGSCPAAQTQSCNAYVCGANACKTSCASSSDCVAGDYCNASSQCVPKIADGGSCSAGAQCTNGSCVDGVCCNTACNGQCQACDVPGKVGVCTAVAGAPHGARTACATDGSSCGGSCDGVSGAACAYPTTSCRSASCTAGTQTAAASCSGGSCPAAQTQACNAYVCGANACKISCASSTDCVAGDYCNASSQCVPKVADGGSCSASAQCTNGNCVDGICCNSACGGQCQACDVPGKVGVCSAVTGAPHGARTACATDGSSCGGSCDGVGIAACAYPTTSCRGASCTAGTQTAAASCSGGSCPAAQTQSCNAYVCGANACKTSCASSTDCVAGDYCNASSQCVPKIADGGSCSAGAQCTNGSCVDGVCCNTACNGQCQACDVPGKVGVCTAVAGAPHGARTACTTDGSSCGGSCDGVSGAACAYPTTSCRSASCTAGTQTAAASCSGGSCPAAQTQACNAYVCGANACKTSCSGDGDCIAGDYCNASSQCVPKVADGGSCSASAQCTNGNCVDGICCNSACGGQCQACDVPGKVGVCSAVTGAPHGARTACATDGSSCGGSCDGVGIAACAYPTTSCRGASCTAGTQTAAASCSGGSCPAAQTQSCNAYVCGANACKTSCASSSDCVAGDYCNASSQCVPKIADGGSCSAGAQCTNGSCVDGVCCNTACNGQCQACDVPGKVGVCTAVAGAPHGARTACATDGSSCGGSCDGVSGAACAYPTTSCRSASCTAGTQTAAASCSGGSCPAAQTQACNAYVCGANACKTSCSGDGDCVTGDFCSAGQCVPKLADGGACSTNTQCSNGHCADGFCCDQACNGQCQACDVPGSVGVCSTVTGAPHGTRAACTTDGSLCGGACDGGSATACAYPTASCRDASCSTGVATLGASCDGSGHCPSVQTQDCNPYVCGASACLGNCVNDANCAAGDYCSGGVCKSKLADGSSCAASTQCANGNCVDGLCCNTACGGQCEACDVAGSLGTCTAVSGGPHGARTACAADGSSCDGVCDGSTRSSCAYPGESTACRSAACDSGVATLAASCNGAGSCPALQTQGCGAYVCGATACKGNCAVDTDCVSGDYCAGGVCAPKLGNGGSCSAKAQCASGECVDGVCCNVACDGQCQACDVAGSAGVCSPVAGAPHGVRAACASDGSSCGGSCDGVAVSACAFPTAECRGASCALGLATLSASCDGAGRCPGVQTQACAPYLCSGAACAGNCTQSSDCTAGDYCAGGVCVPHLGPGGTCSSDDQCGSGHCVDGVCCDTACNGQCEACNVPGNAGTCSPAVGAPRGGRAACATDGSSCGGACDGSQRAACTYPQSQCRAETACASGVKSDAASCDGSGHCPARVQESCGPAPTAGCKSDADCDAADYCAAGTCKPRGQWVVAGAGGCTSTGVAAWPLLLIVAAFALRRRKAALLAAVAMVSAAQAQTVSTSFTVDRFQPGAGAFDVLGVSSPETARDFDWHGSAFADYARDPLRLIPVGPSAAPDQVRLLRNQSMLHLGGSIGFGDDFEVGAVLPIALAQGSGSAPMLGGGLQNGVASSGFGDLRLLPKIRLFSAAGLVLGAGLPLSLPTGRSDAFLSQGSITATPTAMLELQRGIPVRLLANAGIILRSGQKLTNLNVGTALAFGLAGELPFTLRSQKLAALATLQGEANLAAGGAVERPMELMAALRWTPLEGLDLIAGGGPGLTNGYGTPRYRMFFSFAFTPAVLPSRRKPALPPAREPAMDLPSVMVKLEPAPPSTIIVVEPPGPVVLVAAELSMPEPEELAKLDTDTGKIDLLAPVQFKHDSDVLLGESRGVLDAAVSVLKGHPEIARIRIEGHTDNHGKPAYNKVLSQRRATSVMRYMVKHGIAAGRLEARGFGDEHPVDSNATEKGRAVNRRVELLILSTKVASR